MTRPKPFQEATIEAACRALKPKRGRKPRFLVADEVGLGKTIVAQHIIARLAARRRKRPLVVFYVCSSLTIAAQNSRKLVEAVDSAEDPNTAICSADRLSMLPFSARPTHSKVHLYTLTPDTSLPDRKGRRRDGRKDERALLKALVRRCFPGIFEGEGKGKEFSDIFPRQAALHWEEACIRAEALLNGSLKYQGNGIIRFAALFKKKLREMPELSTEKKLLTALQARAKQEPLSMLATLRTALILCVLDLEEFRPDLVIFDEFQKFPDLVAPAIGLDGSKRSEVSHVLSILRGDEKGMAVPLLLLSATPYSLSQRKAGDSLFGSHHENLLELLCFLFGDHSLGLESALEARNLFGDFGRLLLEPTEALDFDAISQVRDKIEKHLTIVMSRTERALGVGSRQGGEPEKSPRPIEVETEKGDWLVFRHASIRFPDKYRSSAVAYWRSIPLPMQSMGSSYIAWRRANEQKGYKRRGSKAPKFTQEHVARHTKFRWPHGKLRALQGHFGGEELCLPWLPPSLPWWPLEGVWRDNQGENGKLLLFSRFRATPRAVAAALSHDARVKAAGLGDMPSSGGSLRLNAERMPVFALFYPFLWLAEATDPLLAAGETSKKVRKKVQEQLRAALESRGIRVVRGAVRRGQRKPEFWRLLAALDATFVDARPDWRAIDVEQCGVIDAWEHASVLGLDEVSESELGLLSDHAIGAPGVVLARSLSRHLNINASGQAFSRLIQFCLNDWRRYFDNPVFVATLRRRRGQYPDSLLRAVVQGNLESVLDEHLWFLTQSACADMGELIHELATALGIRGGRAVLHDPNQNRISARCPCDVAMPLSQDLGLETEAGEARPPRADQIRKAFNSPFWPFVLTTTSVGQEGLDFHPWCKTLVHWDLPSNPVDLEQREGRIQRYAGLSVRRKMASEHGAAALSEPVCGASPWKSLADIVDKFADETGEGLSPWWHYPGAGLESYFFHLPGSEEVHDLEFLKRQRALYRLSLGQQHQEDFLRVISAKDPEVIKKLSSLTPDLSAWKKSGRNP